MCSPITPEKFDYFPHLCLCADLLLLMRISARHGKKREKKKETIFVVKPLSEKGRRRGNAQKMSEGEGEDVRGA